MKCQNCGAELKPGDKFCTKCGTRVDPLANDVNQSTVDPNVGVNQTPNNQNNNFGNQQIDSQPQNYQQSFNNGNPNSANMNGQNWNQNGSFQPNFQNNNYQQNPNQNLNQNQRRTGQEAFGQFKNGSLNYFSWFKNTLTKPSTVDQSNNYFGLISFVINSLLVSWVIYIIANPFLNAAAQVEDFLSNSSSQSTNVPSGASLFFKSFLIAFLYFAIYIAIGWLAKRFFINKETSIFNYANILGSYTNSMVIIEIIMIVYLYIAMPQDVSSITQDSIKSLVTVMSILLILMGSIFTVSYTASLVTEKGKMKIDRIYVAVIANIISSIVLFFIISTIVNSQINKYSAMAMIPGILG